MVDENVTFSILFAEREAAYLHEEMEILTWR